MPPPLCVALIRLAASLPPRQQRDRWRFLAGLIREAQQKEPHRALANTGGDAPKMRRAWKGGSSRTDEVSPASVRFAPGSDDHRTAIASISISQPGWANAVTPTSVDAGA